MNRTLKLPLARTNTAVSDRIRNFLTFAIFAAFISCSQQGIAQQNLPFDVFGEPIDNQQIYRHIEKNAVELVARQPDNAVQKLREQLESVGINSKINFNALNGVRPAESESLYRHMVKSSVYLSELYNCGRCDRTHAGFSGGVVISEDGLVLTNHHVLEGRATGRTEGFMAMTYDGTCWEVEEVVASNPEADVALVRLKSNGHKFYAAPIATTQPDPMDAVRIISNPSGEFFVMTEGEVSRYSRLRPKRNKGKVTWMEVTAEFGGGSSGSAVFNAQGEVVGIVSRIKALVRRNDPKDKDNDPDGLARGGFVEMILRRCVPLDAIHDCFEME